MLFDLFSIILYSVTYGVKDDITLRYIEDITWPRGDTKFIFER